MSKISVVGIDLGKSTFHLYAVDRCGRAVVKKALSRQKLDSFVSGLEPCMIGMEACSGAHHWARRFRRYGHNVRLMSPQFVRPYVKSNKNDFLDAEAICEAVTRPNMRFVPIKSTEQQELQQLHRARSLAVAQRTAQANQIRGFLLEYGLTMSQGIRQLRQRLPELLEDGENGLSFETRMLLEGLREELAHLDLRVAEFDRRIEAFARRDEACQRLQKIPGVGPVVATALIAAVGDASVFKSGRELAAWMGLVPRQHSTGGRSVLLGISKRGDTYLRMLLIHGARAALRVAKRRTDQRSRWVVELAQRRGKNIAAVALANKNVRTAWALLINRSHYEAAAS